MTYSWDDLAQVEVIVRALRGQTVRAMCRHSAMTPSQVMRCYRIKAGIKLRDIRNEEGQWGRIAAHVLDAEIVTAITRRVRAYLPDLPTRGTAKRRKV